MTKARPKTGEKRRTRQPLKIDRLPLEVRDAIQQLKDRYTWEEIEELSALPFNPKWRTEGGGFVNWEGLPTPVLELFSDMRLPHSNLHRWFDLRISQVAGETMARAAQARELAQAFTKSVVKGGDKAVLNAIRDVLMSLIAENTDTGSRVVAVKGLIALAQKQQTARLNDLRERQVAVEEKAIQMKLDQIKAKAASLMGTIENADGKKAPQLTREELLEKVREIYGAV